MHQGEGDDREVVEGNIEKSVGGIDGLEEMLGYGRCSGDICLHRLKILRKEKTRRKKYYMEYM